MTDYLSAREAAEVLGISVATLYSYVSRGLIRSEVADAGKRTHRYRRKDIDKLKQRKEQRRDPHKIVEDALHWGTPLLESAITLIANNRLYYRGYDALQLAAEYPIEAVAALIWRDDLAADLPELRRVVQPSERVQQVSAAVASLPAIDRFQCLLPLAAADDLAAYDLQPDSVVQTGGRILRLLAAIASQQWRSEAAIAAQLSRGWALADPQAEKLLNMALVLCADHELNVSSFTARCVASAGATPYQTVIAGLSALQGVKHGRITERVEAFLREVAVVGGVRPAVASRLKRGESLPGFGHPLYPDGDPRGKMLLEAVAAAYPDAPAVSTAQEIVAAAHRVLGKLPTIDFGLVTLARALKLPAGSPLTLFALGRAIGWVGHALETYRTDRIIRPRASYVGEPPKN